MTIAMAFYCRDGAVLCADTQLTFPNWFKYKESKITVVSSLRPRVFVVYAGLVEFSKMHIERIARRLNDESKQFQLTGLTPSGVLQDEAERIHLDNYRLYADPDSRPELNLLVVFQSLTTISVYKVTGPIVSRVKSYECIGIGQSLARALAAVLWKENMDVKETSFNLARLRRTCPVVDLSHKL